jgi:hypothetical protein
METTMDTEQRFLDCLYKAVMNTPLEGRTIDAQHDWALGHVDAAQVYLGGLELDPSQDGTLLQFLSKAVTQERSRIVATAASPVVTVEPFWGSAVGGLPLSVVETVMAAYAAVVLK